MNETISRKISAIIPKGSLRQRYFGGAFWTLFGSGISQVATFVALLIVARMLGSNAFGEYGMVQSTTGMLGLLAGLGLGLTTTKYVGELRNTDPARCGRLIGLATNLSVIAAGAVALGLWLGAPVLATQQLNAPQLALSLRIASLTLVFSAMTGVQTGTLMGLEAFRVTAYINLARAIFTLVLVIGGARLFGVNGIFAGMAVTAAATFLATASVQRQASRKIGIEIKYRNVWGEARTLWAFTLPGLLAMLLPGVVFWLVRGIIARQPNGYAELGVFTAADQWTQIMSFIAAGLNQVALPILSNIYGSSDWQRFRKMVLGNVLLPVFITLVFALLVIISAPWIARAYGESFTGLLGVLRIVGIVAVMQVLGGALGNLLASLGEMWWGLLFNSLWGAVLIGATSLLAKDGALGLARAYLIAYACHSVWGSVFSWRRIQALKQGWTGAVASTHQPAAEKPTHN